MKTRSIRTRLTVWYAGALTAALVLFGFLIQASLERRLISEIDEDLADRATRFENYFLHESAEKASYQLNDELEEFCAALPLRSFVELRSGNGIVFRYPAGHATADLTTRTFERAFYSAGARYDLTVSESVRAVNHTIAVLRLQLLTMTPLAILVACLGGWLLSRRALKPVNDMAATAEAISIDNLAVRLDVPGTGDELERLGEVLNKMLARLDGAVNTLSQFVADASHELRTPLAVIRTSAELALRRARSPGEYREALVGIAADTERMTALVENLLFLARSDAAAEPEPAAPVDLNEILTESAQAVEHLAEARSVTIVMTSDDCAATVAGRRSALRRMLLALMDNAIKNSPPNSEIRISVEHNTNSIAVSIRDFGRGIDPADLPHIFKRFYRADKARTGDGYGLGLSIAESIARAHGAEISVESAAGAGATFVVRMPVTAEAGNAPRSAARISA
jgi:two-component system, OmpR family, heavy metal sensor histidine kinase CusS